MFPVIVADDLLMAIIVSIDILNIEFDLKIKTLTEQFVSAVSTTLAKSLFTCPEVSQSSSGACNYSHASTAANNCPVLGYHMS